MVAKATLTKQGNELIELYVKNYTVKYGKRPDMNRFATKWAFQDMISDYGMEGSRAIIDFYFDTPRPGHTVNYLTYNYHKLHRVIIEKAEDREKREEIRRKTAERVSEWEVKHGNS